MLFLFAASCRLHVNWNLLTEKTRIKKDSGRNYTDRVKRIWYLSHMRAAKVQASLRIRAVSPEPSLLAHTSSESRGTFRQKARSLAPLNGWACAVEICHDGMLEDTNSLDGAQLSLMEFYYCKFTALWTKTIHATPICWLPVWRQAFLLQNKIGKIAKCLILKRQSRTLFMIKW